MKHLEVAFNSAKADYEVAMSFYRKSERRQHACTSDEEEEDDEDN